MDNSTSGCSKINPSDVWSKQHYSQSCYTACLAMLLRHRGVELDDREIAEFIHTPILIEFDSNGNSYKTSFRAYQEQIQAIVCSRYGYRYSLYNSEHVHDKDYCDRIITFLNENKCPVIVGVMSDLLPDYRYFPSVPGERHAIVVYNFSSEGFHCLNPATQSCLKTSDQDFDSVKYQVSFAMTSGELRIASIGNHIGFIGNEDNEYVIDYDLTSNSRNAIMNWSTIIFENLSALYTSNSFAPTSYRRFKGSYIDPFLSYMREVIDNEFTNNHTYMLISKYLNELYHNYINIENEIRRIGNLNANIIDEIYFAVNKCSTAIENELRIFTPESSNR